MKPHKKRYIGAALSVAGIIGAVVLAALCHTLSGRHVIGEIVMDDGRIIRAVQNRHGPLRTLVGDCATVIEVELASGSVRTATLSADDSVRAEMNLRKKGSYAIVEWCGSQLTIDPHAKFLSESDGKVFQPFDDLVQVLGL